MTAPYLPQGTFESPAAKKNFLKGSLMIRSIFAKYILAFVLIIIVCFALMSVALTFTLIGYAGNDPTVAVTVIISCTAVCVTVSSLIIFRLMLKRLTESLEEASRQRSSLMATVAHDLRTPMTTAAGFVDGILDGTIPVEKHEYYLETVSTEVKRLSRLVSQLLDVSRIEAGERKFNMQPFDVCETARLILISFEQRIEEKRLEIEFACDNENMYANADRDAVHQILYNIIDNAVKFSKEGGELRVGIGYGTDREKILVSVYNEGRGIKPEELPHIFERFYKSDNKTGVGLGMYITKTIIDAHNEKISVESEYGKYCRFGFTLANVKENNQ